MTEINKPQQTTYFIAYDEDKENPSYGTVEPDQVMTSGRYNLYQTKVKKDWEDKLLNEFKITIIE